MAPRLMFSRYLLALLLLGSCGVASAAVHEVHSVYHLYLGKNKLGEVTETFIVSADRYEIESVAKPILGFLLPTLTQKSRGTVTSEGLRPDHFSQHISNRPEKTATADFDWEKGVLSLSFGGKHRQHDLKPQTFDSLSLKYQFLYVPPTGDGTVFLTTGRKLEEYQFRVLNEETVVTPIGKSEALHIAKVTKDDESTFDLWLSKERHYLPVKVVAQDEEQKLEQLLASMKIN
jgi:hypothetical protein